MIRLAPLGAMPNGLLGIPAEELGRISHLALRIGESFAVFERNEIGAPSLVLHHLLEACVKNLGASARRCRRPGLGRFLRCVDRRDSLGNATVGHGGENLVARWVNDIEATAAFGGPPLIAN
jgi:hypothetical protein